MRGAAPVLLAVAPLAVMLCGCSGLGRAEMAKYQASHIQQAVSQYEQARNRSDVLDMCVKAKLVAIAYADAGDGGDHGERARKHPPTLGAPRGAADTSHLSG